MLGIGMLSKAAVNSDRECKFRDAARSMMASLYRIKERAPATNFLSREQVVLHQRVGKGQRTQSYRGKTHRN